MVEGKLLKNEELKEPLVVPTSFPESTSP